MGRLSSKNKLESEISAGESRINKEKLKSEKIKGLTSLYESIIGKINDQSFSHDAGDFFRDIYDGTCLFINGGCIETDREMPKIFASSDRHYYDESNEETVKKLTLNSLFAKNTTVAIASNKAKLSSTPLPSPKNIDQALQELLKELTESNQQQHINGDDILVAEEMVIYCETPQSLDSNNSPWLASIEENIDSFDSNNSPWLDSIEDNIDSLDSNDSSPLASMEENIDQVDLEIESFLKNVQSSLQLNDQSQFMNSAEQNLDLDGFQFHDIWIPDTPNSPIWDYNSNLNKMIEDSKESDFEISNEVYNNVFKAFYESL
jgi:hypothetical protein